MIARVLNTSDVETWYVGVRAASVEKRMCTRMAEGAC